eukprot:gb/GECG01005345.1/.p1 GENE.gb/GECG01005345.1/~~gb/GECG01005345.1/.p1  ORF type:complete len:252 (+),score=16.75 gb/GECG01005345.1/:1-756(+)
MGIFFLNMGGDINNVAGVRSISSVLLLPLAAATTLMTQQSLAHMTYEKPILNREILSHMYTASAYCISQTLAELPYYAIISLSSITFVYFMAAMNTNPADYWHTVLVSFLLNFSTSNLGLLLPAALLNETVAHIVGSLLATLQILFGGVFIPRPSAIEGLQWVYYLNPTAYALNIAASRQLFCDPSSCPRIPVLVDEQKGTQLIGRYEYAHETFDFDYSRKWEFTGYMFLIGMCLRLLGLLALRYRKQVER